jgi:Putative Flp pilus-assembly TadE/G-like
LKKPPHRGMLELEGKISLRAKRRGGDRGQTLILIMLAMPLFFALMSLVVDGGNILVHKRNIQVAADAAALAISQNIDLTTNQCASYGGFASGDASCEALADYYSQKNGGSASLHKCVDPDYTQPSDTNCWAYPYYNKNAPTLTPDYGQAEVRLRSHVTTFIAGVIGIYSADVSARSVAGANPVVSTITTPGSSTPDQTIITPGGTHTTTDPDQVSGGSGIGFAMSRICSALTYSGNPKGQVTGAFATNGGLQFQGAGNVKKVYWLGYDASLCPKPSPDSGTSNCTAKAPPFNDPSDSPNSCVKTLVNLNQNNTLPINWPLTPPTPPTPTALPGTNPYPPDWYPSKCIDLGSTNGTFGDTQHPNHGPGVYCVTGPGTLHLDNLNLSAGDGYTFFALGGGQIGVGSNGSTLKFYWPSACGPGTRPTTRASSYSCPNLGRTISGYDPFTLLYATFASADGTTCAICLNGGNNNLTGDIFAPNPNSFPPSLGPPPQIGGLVSISGGGLAAGSGFIESWNLSLSGNTGSYSGTGTSIVIPGGTHTTTDPATTTVITGTVIAPSTQTNTVGTTIGLGE